MGLLQVLDFRNGSAHAARVHFIRKQSYFMLQSVSWLLMSAICYQVLLKVLQARNGALNLVGRRGVVVGGTSGVGQAIATRLAKAKVAVTILGRNRERGASVVKDLYDASGPGVAHEFVEADTSV